MIAINILMPNSCCECPVNDHDAWCGVTHSDFADDFCEIRLPDCPLIDMSERKDDLKKEKKTMICTKEELIRNLKEMHDYYWRLARKLHEEDDPNRLYELGKADGGCVAIDAILLSVIGGKAMFEVLADSWEEAIEEGEPET